LMQAEQNYKIKKRQNIERMRQVSAELKKVRTEYDMMQELQAEFTIRAPEPGMVIYKKGWDGRPIKEGSQISMWDPTVATLPDLTKMISKTYINEVDVRKVKSGQSVEIGLDAFPEKNLEGSVTRVANVGEQRPNSDAKVFEVTVEIEGTDPTLRPAMTTSNKILASKLDSVLFVPLESLHSHADSITFVYKREGIGVLKQEVKVGVQNTDEAVIELGLAQNDRVYLSVPKGLEDMAVALLPEMNGKRNIQEKEVEEINPEIKTITLPDGRIITVPANEGAPGGEFARGAKRQEQTGGQRSRAKTGESGQKAN
ncbi:MAG: HlyD family efflux transporter periplasmic adaptor subunit, partial [Cyclobacteriaceae bacterium]|nr:HlyD family efflux transporter periplasmic adaptor subunit [Cyclobacteriaceae bacterium]